MEQRKRPQMLKEQAVRARSEVLEGASPTRVRIKFKDENSSISGTTVSFVRTKEGPTIEAISPLRAVPLDLEKILGAIALEEMNKQAGFKQAAE